MMGNIRLSEQTLTIEIPNSFDDLALGMLAVLVLISKKQAHFNTNTKQYITDCSLKNYTSIHLQLPRDGKIDLSQLH